MTLIATRHLTRSQVPSIDPARIDYRDDVREQLGPLWSFALSFDVYRYFGGDEDANPRLGNFAESFARAYVREGRVPELAEIGMLRACLFYEQRDWCNGAR